MREEQRLLWQAVQQLSPAHRAVIVLRYYEGLSEAEMAAGRRALRLAAAVAALSLVASTGLAVAAKGWRKEPPGAEEAMKWVEAVWQETAELAKVAEAVEKEAPELKELRLSEPLPGAKIIDRYGERIHPVLDLKLMHTGVDFNAHEGEPVVAAADGVVVAAAAYPGLGNVVVISHGKVKGVPVSTWYAHNEKLLVKPGQQVKRGEQIALAGSTGAATGPHLHLEVRVGGLPVDPMQWLQFGE
jgi:murein DD-endopeptidase MepM/ murein hydrolase activator NlpD